MTLERAKAVVASGNRKFIDQMNRSGKVNGAYKNLVVQQKAEAIKKEPSPLPEGPFRVIVIDPPWKYETRAEDPSHRTARPYPEMTLDEIKAWPIASRAFGDSILWLWTTNAFLPQAFELAVHWGFSYKTLLTWGKDKFGTGDWLRGQTEHCLMCIRGKPVTTLTNQSTLLLAPAGKHSEKPEAFYELVEALCPGSKLEIFQRKPRPGWVGWGDEV
jgi:N6-adenosine-specific RNA methylase IME4